MTLLPSPSPAKGGGKRLPSGTKWAGTSKGAETLRSLPGTISQEELFSILIRSLRWNLPPGSLPVNIGTRTWKHRFGFTPEELPLAGIAPETQGRKCAKSFASDPIVIFPHPIRMSFQKRPRFLLLCNALRRCHHLFIFIGPS